MERREPRFGMIGGSGYIGRNLSLRLGKSGLAYDLIDGDVVDPWFMRGVDIGLYDAIYYLAGVTGVELSFEHPEQFMAVNVMGLLNLCCAISRWEGRKPKIVFPSSRLVYRGGVGLMEDAPLEARSMYAASKISGEAVLSAYHHRFGVPYCALRIGQVFGNEAEGCVPKGVYASFERQAKAGGPVTVYGDGAAVRTWTYIGDLCDVMIRVAEDAVPSGVYNMHGNTASVADIAESIAHRLGAKVEHIEWPDDSILVDTGDAVLDASLIGRRIVSHD